MEQGGWGGGLQFGSRRGEAFVCGGKGRKLVLYYEVRE